MNVKMEYPWYEQLPFILFTALFWVFIFPIPFTVFLTLKRLEKKQLSRLIIAKILGIDYYREEIAQMTKTNYSNSFKFDLDVSESTYQNLAKVYDDLRKEYDFIVFKKVLDEKLASQPVNQNTNENHNQTVLSVHDIIEDSEIEKEHIKKENEKFHRKERIKPIIKHNRIVIDEEDLFSDDVNYFF